MTPLHRQLLVEDLSGESRNCKVEPHAYLDELHTIGTIISEKKKGVRSVIRSLESQDILDYVKRIDISRDQLLETDQFNESILYDLVRRDFDELATILKMFKIQYDDLLVENKNSNSSLHWMCWNGCQYLSEFGIRGDIKLKDLTKRNIFGRSSLEGLFYSFALEFDWLLNMVDSHKALIVERSPTNASPLYYLVKAGGNRFLDGVGFSREDLLVKTSDGDCVLSCLCNCTWRKNKLTTLLDEYKITSADLIEPDNNGYFPFYWLCYNTYPGLPTVFKKYEFTTEILLKSPPGTLSSFYWLCAGNYRDLKNLFQSYNIPLQYLFMTDEMDESPFSWICALGSPCIPYLFEHYEIPLCELVKQDPEGWSPFRSLCKGFHELLPMIFDKYEISNEDLLGQSQFHVSPFNVLCETAYPGLPEVFKNFEIPRSEIIAELGSDTPLNMLCRNGYTGISRLHEKYLFTKAQICRKFPYQKSPLSYLCHNNSPCLGKIMKESCFKLYDFPWNSLKLLCVSNSCEIFAEIPGVSSEVLKQMLF